MQEQLDVDAELLFRYIAGQATLEDRRTIDMWIGTSPRRRAWVASMRDAVVLDDVPPLDIEAARHQIARRTGVGVSSTRMYSSRIRGSGVAPHALVNGGLASTMSAKAVSASAVRSRTRGAWYAAIGAALGVVAVIGSWRIAEHRVNATLAEQVTVYATPKGQRSSVVLPDGSTIMLNVASRLEVPGNYGTGNRTLRLTGEALFTVAHGERSPFTVMAGSSVTRVLGTRFMVRAYESDSNAVIAVREGKVAVGAKILTAMEQINVYSHGEGDVQPAQLAQFGFASGVMTLEKTPLREAIPMLNRWYNADIQLGDTSLALRSLTAECATSSLTDLVEILEWTFNMQVVRQGRVLTLYPRS